MSALRSRLSDSAEGRGGKSFHEDHLALESVHTEFKGNRHEQSGVPQEVALQRADERIAALESVVDSQRESLQEANELMNRMREEFLQVCDAVGHFRSSSSSICWHLILVSSSGMQNVLMHTVVETHPSARMSASHARMWADVGARAW